MFIVYVYWFMHILYRSFMVGWGFSSGWGRDRLRKHGLPHRTRALPITSAAPMSTTPTIATTSTPLGHLLHTQEFIMITNLGYVKPRSLLSFPTQPSPFPPPPPGGEARTSPIPSSTPTPSLLPTSLVWRVPKTHCPHPHRAPWTSMWSSDIMINSGK